MTAHKVMITIAGSGLPGFSGDGGKALQATLNAPQKNTLTPDGSVYVADRVNHRFARSIRAA